MLHRKKKARPEEPAQSESDPITDAIVNRVLREEIDEMMRD
jgi:hypothetical protein